MAKQERAELYAMYVQAVNEDPDSAHPRTQWVVFPQMPARLAPGDSPVTSTLCWFERMQRHSKHRSPWRFHMDNGGQLKERLPDQIRQHEAVGWTIGPVVTCELHPTELAAILRERRTPYRVLSRLTKVARSLHRLDIS